MSARSRRGSPTVTDVAQAAGVTPAVVSRVLNGDASLRVREETRRRVLEAAKALDYTPNTSARALRMASSGAICLVVSDVANPINAAILQGAQRSAERSQHVMLLADSHEFEQHPERLRSMIDSRRVDGLVMHLPGGTADRAMRQASESRLPTVIVNSRVRGPAGCVSLDDSAAARLATEHLVALGHERIGLITGLPGSDRSVRRQRGVEDALAAGGLSLRPEWRVEGGFEEALGHAAGRRLLARKPRPTAVVVANVMAAIGVLAACSELGIDVPRELSVIGLLDVWFCEHTSPSLTVVDMPVGEMGAEAVRLLVDMIDGRPRQSVVLRDPAPRLVLRRSTAPPAR